MASRRCFGTKRGVQPHQQDPRGPSNHPARYNLAYDEPVTTRRVSKAAPP
ncbi:hypothetical protein [Rhodopirellula baltica]